MLKFSTFLALIFQFSIHIVFGQAVSKNAFPAQTIKSYFAWKPGKKPIFSAHRGGPQQGLPENSLKTLKHTKEMGAEILEIDVNMTKDSVLVLLHDNSLDRTTTGTGLLCEKMFDEIQNFKLVDSEGNITSQNIPMLDSVLAWAKEKVILSIDLKKNVPFKKVAEAVKRSSMENNVIIIAYSIETLQIIDKIAPELMISANIRNLKELDSVINTGVSFSKIVAFTGTAESDEILYEKIHTLGSSCIIGTMGNLDRKAKAKGISVYHTLIDKGINVIAGDESALILEAIESYKN